ncbi:hypothetical protein B0H14DRAFT_3143074 [Mycena olivaceomarginata]|nr:hypothetical protein B0H14DRAFT_3143074 [Mycena olivaceomarginata]
MSLVTQNITHYTYSIPQPGSAHWSSITVALCANRESKREGISAYSMILTIKYSRLSPNEWEEEDARWFFDPTTEGSRIEWTSSDSFSAGLIGLAFQVIGDLPEAIEQGCYTPNSIRTLICLFLERAFGEEGVRTLKMMDNGATSQIVKTFHFVLVNELFPWTGKASEGHPPGEMNEIVTASLETEINPSPSPCASQRTAFDSDWQIPEIASRRIGHNLGDDFGDGVFADDESNGEKLPEESDEEEVFDSPRESERDDEEEPDDGERLPGELDEEAALRYHRERDGDSSEDEVKVNDDEEPDNEEALPEESDEEEVLEYPREYKPEEEEPDDEEELLEQSDEEEDLTARDSELDGDSSEDEVEGNGIDIFEIAGWTGTNKSQIRRSQMMRTSSLSSQMKRKI